MEIFKIIGTAYKTLKAAKDNLEELSNKNQISVEESSKESKIKTDKEYKRLFEEYKKINCHISTNDFLDFLAGKISKDEYGKRSKIFEEKNKQAIADVESGNKSCEEFFNN